MQLSSVLIRIRSSSTIALLITIPDSEITPSSVIMPKQDRATSRLATTPISASGIVSNMVTGVLIELNWAVNSNTMISRAIGSLAAIAKFAFPDVSASPPNSQN
jgi:hypothetical protein